jgi:hypothetical protein
MTPLFDRVSRFVPAWVATLVVSLLYAALLVLNFTLLISPHTFGVIYLDIGR